MSKQHLGVIVALDWLAADQGGRKRPIGTADYAATISFSKEDEQLFSIVLHFPSKIENDLKVPTRTDIAQATFLMPDLVAAKIEQGSKFRVTEGGRVVANAEVLF
jgi:hypothetical protein